MKKGDTAVVRLEKVVPGGQSLGVLPDGRKVFVWGGLPGETVEVEIFKSKKSYAEAVVVNVLEPSPHRIEPRDACYLSTSPWQIFDYDYELAQKAELVAEAFRQQGIVFGRARMINGLVASDKNDFFYRNKMEYALWWDNETDRISLAFHKRGTHTKIPIDQSSIERPEIFTEAQRVVADLNARGEQARKYQSLLVRCNQNGEARSALLENGRPHPHLEPLTDTILGREYSYSPNGFFQINLPVYEMALREIAKHLGNAEKVVDMYAGVGTIGLSVAAGRELTLVETDKSAYKEMGKNITHDIKSRTRVVLEKSENALEYITGDITLIVDPPRAGLDEKVVARILETWPPHVIYLSCDPTTQARDIMKLLSKYQISHQQAFNFFPRTPHIENLIVLEKA